MKASIVFASCFVFAVARAAADDNLLSKKSPPQRIAHPATGVHTMKTSANVRRNNPFVRPLQRGAVAMNVQSSIRYDQSRQGVAPLPQGERVSPTINNPGSTSARQSYFDALRRFPRERHDRNWWKQHCRTIVFVSTGYYYLDAGYWYPAYGYDQSYDYYDNDGPIYTYGNLLPDEVIANVQRALQQTGYYAGPVTGSIGSGTRTALANFQSDYGLIVTSAIDEPTVASLGLN